jgi:hypothetical protein
MTMLGFMICFFSVFPVLDLVRLFPIHMDWMGLEKILKKFDLFGIQTHPISLNPHGLRANRTRPYNAICTFIGSIILLGFKSYFPAVDLHLQF